MEAIDPPRRAVQAALRPDRNLIGNAARRLIQSEYFILVICGIYALAAYPFVPVLFTGQVAGNILADMMPLLIVAVGQTFVLIIAGIDLSVTAIVALSAVIGASVMTLSGGYVEGSAAVPVALAAMLGVGIGIGLVNGLSVTLLNMPPFLVTLATRMFFAGLAIWYTTFHTTSSSIANLPSEFTAIADGYILSLPVGETVFNLPILPVLVALAIVAISHLILSHSTLGHWIYAVGANRKAAFISGVPVNLTIVIAFAISGLCAALTGILMSARLQTGTPILGENILLDVIGAVVIGGTSLFGGKGKVIWTVFGVLFLVLLDTTLKLFGASLFLIFIIKGSVILVAAILDTLRNRIFAEQ
jgi:ribose/xylose/arabinose/galactoside ABC-type transport system permease subunit